MRPENAIQVRADEVKVGDELWIENERHGIVRYSERSRFATRSIWFLGCSDGADRGIARDVYRGEWEPVWVVRAPVVHEITVKLTEEQARARAAIALSNEYVPNAFGEAVRAFDAACAEWVANHPERGGDR